MMPPNNTLEKLSKEENQRQLKDDLRQKAQGHEDEYGNKTSLKILMAI